jgi:predicted ATPase/signal transduction histidine kinase/CheY-like chemotaxis protein
MKIENFEISKVLKKEVYKTVYLAHADQDFFLMHEYANPEIAGHEFMLSKYISSPCVEQFIDRFESKGKAYLIQERLERETLDQHFTKATPLPEKMSFARSLLSILKEVHDKGVIYNNLSLETISTGSNGSILLHNFAPAKIVGDNTGPVFQHVLNPYFVAPERSKRVAGEASFASDYYAFGVLLYWLLTGRLPFLADNISQLISLHVAGQPVSPVSVNPAISERLSDIVLKLMEKDRSDRYNSIDGILYDLENYDAPDFQIAQQDMDLKFTVSGKIYGRELETGQLKEALKGLQDGQGRLVTISGYSGVGKSTIVTEFQKALSPDECRLISGKFQQYKKDIPYFALVEAFDELFDMLLLSDQEILDDFRKAFEDCIGDQGLILTSVFPKLELIVGKQAPVDKLVGEEAENRFHYVFLKLINIIANEKRPLVLFLDDLQWTDLVSLNVLRAIFQNSTGYLLMVLCYRSNEVDRHHPFQQFLDEIKHYDIGFQEIGVEDLKPHDVSQLIQDSMGSDNPDLSRVVFEKTHGNAFFVHQLLKGLADQDYFVRDAKNNVWTIDLEKVSGLQVSSNVVDLMQTRLRRLPREVTDLIRIIGAVGHNVDLDILSIITGKNKKAISQTLKLPFEDGLLNQKQNHIYFAHDKIQQACYQLNPPGELPRLHFTIATTLIGHELFQSLDELFNIVGHLDKGFDFIREDFERYIEIYMMAALKSKEISAYKEFLVYVRQAMSLLNESVNDAIRYQVYREYHIALYLNSMFEQADAFFYEKLIGYENLFELKENYFSKVSQDSMLRNYKNATEFGMSILKKLGIELVIDPEIEDLRRELKEVETLFEKAGITKISELQNIERKNIDEMEFICELILAMVPAAFFHNPTVACLLIFTTLKLAVKNGVFEAMGYPLSVGSTPFILIRNDYQAGYEYAEYAMQIAANNKRSLGNSKHLFILFCWHWSKPMKDDTALEIARDAHHLLMQGGDIQMAGYTYYNTVTYLWERGEALESVLAEAEKGLDFNNKTQNLHGTALISPHYQVSKTLLSNDGDHLNLSMDGFDEGEFVKNNEQNFMGLCFFYIYKTQLAYMFGAADEAHHFGCKARELLHFITGFPSTQAGVFYGALSACAVLDPADEQWTAVISDLEQLKRWNEGAPENFKHKLHLLEAEIARKKGEKLRAIERYTKALSASKENRFVHETALICERFSSFWEETGNEELSEYYAKQAFHYYELWGAKRKCEQLQQRYPNVYLESKAQDLDLLSVIDSQNVLAQETNIENLLKQMMQILLEVSGAERVFLILKDDTWSIEAFKNIKGEESILEGIPLRKEMLSVDMVNYVIRTAQIANLDQFSGHLDDEYLKRVKPQSLIIQPAIVSSRMIALIYLEHTRIKNMFTPSKQEMVKLLSTQVAISLNNARIYNQLEQRVRERTQELAAQNKELAMARKKADEANEAKSEFLANMSHELRTPLNAVTGFSELLTSMVSDPKQQTYLDAIKAAGRNLLTLINDILDLSKIEAGSMNIHYAPVKLESIFMEIEQIFNIKIKEKNLDFSSTRSPGFPEWLYLDEIRIRQILFNLVGNAIKFTESGYVKISAHWAPKRENSIDLILSVEDTGIGIPEQEQERIFKSFEQQSNQDAAKYGGTGLGLAITRRLVELMDGHLSVSSSPGKGSRFDARFLDVEMASSESQIVESGRITLENIEFNSSRVLVVDDVESNRVLLKEILSKVNLEVSTAKNGQEAIILAEELKPELILMDIRMPVLSGFDAFERLRAGKETAQIPVIALTASSTKRDRSHALRQGFDGFLPKPISFDRLITELSQHLDHETLEVIPLESLEMPGRIDIKAIDQPYLLIQRLKMEVLPYFGKLKKAFVASDYKYLAEMITRVGKEFQLQQFRDYGAHMFRLLDTFDIKEMDAFLKTHSEKIEILIGELEHFGDG